MKYDIFKNQKEKNEAKKALPELVEHPGWKIILKALDSNITFLTDELKESLRAVGSRGFESVEQASAAQKRIDDLEALKNLPATIVEAAQDDPPEEDDSIYE